MERMVPGLAPEHIYRDHVERYLWAASKVAPGSSVLDYFCGTGYGSHLLASSAGCVVGFDREVVGGGTVCGVTFGAHALSEAYDYAVFFEGVEHVEDAGNRLRDLAAMAHRLFISTPNRNISSPDGTVNNPYHVKEYDVFELRALLSECGWVVDGMYGQRWQLVPKSRLVRKAYKRLFRPWERTSAKVVGWSDLLYPDFQPEYLVLTAARRD